MAKKNLRWERVISDWVGTDPAKLAISHEIATRFTSVPMLVNHARGFLKVFTPEEKARVFPDGKGVAAVAIIVWRMLEACSGDAGQRAHRCMYCTGKRSFPPDPVAKGMQVEVVVPARVDPNYQVLVRMKQPPVVPLIVVDDEEE